MSKRQTIWWSVAAVIVILLGALWFGRSFVTERLLLLSQEPVPSPVRPAEVVRETEPLRQLADEEAPVKPEAPAVGEINLAIPFTPQAPFADWEQPYQDACEEAALLMAERSLSGGALSPEIARTEILQMVEWQEQNFGFYTDTNIAETARLAEGYFPALSATPVYDITADDIRREVALGHPVVVLVDGRILANPFYTAPGPDKHALVVKGFSGNSFITHDPGTRRGGDFVYSAERLMAALIDYDGGTPGTGTRAMIIVSLASS